MRLFFLKSTDPTVNLAVEEQLAQDTEETIFMLWQNAPSIIVGRHQNTAAEIDGEFVSSRNIPVVRRITGGGAVYHDLGNINYSCISLERKWGAESALQFTRPIVNALRQLNILAEFSGRNDILVNGLKVSGCARSVPRAHTLFHGTLLFDTDLEILAKALKPDLDKIRSKGIKSVRARVGNLKTMLPEKLADMDMSRFISHLQASISAYYGGQPFEKPEQELIRRAEALAEVKYRTWNWNYGTSLDYEVSRKISFGGGRIQAQFNVTENKISNLVFSGDFFGSYAIEALIERLSGQIPVRQVLAHSLTNFPIQNYISGITEEELLSLLVIE